MGYLWEIHMSLFLREKGSVTQRFYIKTRRKKIIENYEHGQKSLWILREYPFQIFPVIVVFRAGKNSHLKHRYLVNRWEKKVENKPYRNMYTFTRFSW